MASERLINRVIFKYSIISKKIFHYKNYFDTVKKYILINKYYKNLLLYSQKHLDESLIFAAHNNNIYFVKALVNIGANPRARNDQPLISSIITDKYNNFDYFISAGANPQAQNNKPIIMAASTGNIKIFNRLVELGVNINDDIDEIKYMTILWKRYDLLPRILELSKK